jgi:hypothetical protein
MEQLTHALEVTPEKVTRKVERPVSIMRQGAYIMQRFDIE